MKRLFLDDQKRREALLDALEEHQGSLLRYAYSLTGSEEAAQDIVQEVFLRLWKADLKKIEKHLAPWLFHVCRNVGYDRFRKEKHTTPVAQVDAGLANDPEQEEAIVHEQSVDQVMELVKKLPPKQQEIVRLRFQAELSYKEIAQALDMSQNHVGVALHKIMNRLRKDMKSLASRQDEKKSAVAGKKGRR